MTKEKIEKAKDSIRGFVLGDIAGVPYEFLNPDNLKTKQFHFMDRFEKQRSHQQPVGSWSDDTGMMLAAMDGIVAAELYDDPLMDDHIDVAYNFLSWYVSGEYMPFGVAFDIGATTEKSLRALFSMFKQRKFNVGISHLEEFIYSKSRLRTMKGDSNGSLMRILPHVLFSSLVPSRTIHPLHLSDDDYVAQRIKDVVYLTHPSMVCYLTCLLYRDIILSLWETGTIEGVGIGQRKFLNMFDSNKQAYQTEWISQVQQREIGRWTPNLKYEIRSLLDNLYSQSIDVNYQHTFGSVGALRVAIWALVSSSSFKEVIEKAVMYGGDTDTTACIAGSMAGMIFDVPDDWYDQIPKKEFVDDLIQKFMGYFER